VDVPVFDGNYCLGYRALNRVLRHIQCFWTVLGQFEGADSDPSGATHQTLSVFVKWGVKFALSDV